MTTLRITVDIRDDIVDRAVLDVFGPKQDVINAAEHRLAAEARLSVYGAEIIAKVEALPREWFHSAGAMEYNCGGPSIKLEHNIIHSYPDRTRYGGHKPYIKDDALRAKVLAHADQRDQLKIERKAAREALENLIRNCCTLKKLTEMWPEGHAYYKHLEGKVASTPTVRADTVNAMLGLPKGTRDESQEKK